MPAAFANLAYFNMTPIRPFALARTLLPLACRRIAYLLLLWLAGSLAPAMASATSSAKGEIRPAVLYRQYCSVCHGEKGDGRSRAQGSLNPPPRDFSTPAASQLTRASMIAAVTNGRPGTAMTGWKTQLKPKEIEALVDYVRNTFMMASSSAGSSRGRTVYSKNCSVCHGEKGDGRSRAQGSLNPPPIDFTNPGVTATLTQDRMITSVTYGRPDTAMAGFKGRLSQADINAVVDYIRAGFMAGSATTIANAPKPASGHIHKHVGTIMSEPMPNGLKGNVAQGETFYMKNCATCHGESGDGRGPRAYFINPKPRNFLHPAAREMLNRVELFEMISEGKPGTEMPAWNKVLNPQEIANVSEFVFQRFIQPGAVGAQPAKAAK